MSMKLSILSAFLLFASPALAQERVIDMTQMLSDLDGKVIPDQIGRDPVDEQCTRCNVLTLGIVIAHALMWSSPDDQKLSAEQKFSRGMMAERLRNNKTATLDAGETKVIQDLLARLYGPAIMLPAMKILDPNIKPEKLR